jgi:hypothetical protein
MQAPVSARAHEGSASPAELAACGQTVKEQVLLFQWAKTMNPVYIDHIDIAEMTGHVLIQCLVRSFGCIQPFSDYRLLQVLDPPKDTQKHAWPGKCHLLCQTRGRERAAKPAALESDPPQGQSSTVDLRMVLPHSTRGSIRH